MSEPDERDALRGEASAIARSVRAHLEQLRDSGADGVPVGVKSKQPRVTEVREPVREQAPRRQEIEPVRAAPAPKSAPAPMPVAVAPVVPVTMSARIDDSAPIDRAVAKVRLDVLSHEVAGCTKCVLHSTRTQTVFARGNIAAELMFIGEGPGADEDAQGLPFVGKAGQLLDKMIVAMGYAPSDVYVANVVKCRPPANRKPEPNEMSSCVGYLAEQIDLVRPKAIVALGATACEGLLGVTGITKLRGKWRLYRNEYAVMPTFHPAYLLRNPPAKREVWMDLQQVMAKLGKKIAPPEA